MTNEKKVDALLAAFGNSQLNARSRSRPDWVKRFETLIKSLHEDRLFDLYAAGQIPKMDFGQRHRPISERDELPCLQAEQDVLKVRLVFQEVAAEDAKDLAERWEGMAFEERRQLVENDHRPHHGREG
jgi:hypothetical protein